MADHSGEYESSLDGLVDRARSGRPFVLNRRTVERILFLTTTRVPVEATLFNVNYFGGGQNPMIGAPFTPTS